MLVHEVIISDSNGEVMHDDDWEDFAQGSAIKKIIQDPARRESIDELNSQCVYSVRFRRVKLRK